MDIGCHFPLGIVGSFGFPSSPADFNWDGIVDELDLELMNACMGATNDPNFVRLDMDYSSRVDMPDWGLFAYDYGYAADPNDSSNNDPNCARSDFDGDGAVDLGDMAVFGENWLRPVFDEYRVCSLCNLHTAGADPNDPNAGAGADIIDSRDYDALMADWGKTTVTDYAVSFRDGQGNLAEPNALSGLVALYVDEFPAMTTWLFAQIDGWSAGQVYADDSAPLMFEIPTSEFDNGNHTITLGGYTSESGCWLKEIPVQFHNRLYFASIPEMYEPNEPYEIRGFFDGGTMTVWTDPNESTVSDSGYICHSSVISADSAEATLSYENGGPAEVQSVSLLASVNMAKVDPNSYRALIIAPDEDANIAFDATLEAIRDVLDAKNISKRELLWKNATWDNISIALRGGNLNYVYWIGHMNSQVGEERTRITKKVTKEGIHRTSFRCWEKGLIRDNQQDKIFSFLISDNPPSIPQLDPLPNDWDNRGRSMYSLGLWKTKKIKEFWAIGCESGLEWKNAGGEYEMFNDMAGAVGAYRKDTHNNYVSAYIGNRNPVWVGALLPDAIHFPDALAGIIRNHGDNHSLEYAFIYGPHGDDQRKSIWGDDLDRDSWPDNAIQWWPKTTKLDWIQLY